jgi:glycerophosphoryl diester phosphodiesterase
MSANPFLDLGRRLIVAHRGNRVRAPENTVPSLRQAVELGADALEFDVRMSRDGVPVVIHDPTLDRTTDGTGPVSAHTVPELQALDASARSPYRIQRVSIPTLEEVLDGFRETPLVIEVKEMEAAESTAKLVRRFGLQERAVIGSARYGVMEWFYSSGLCSCASMRDATRMIAGALVGIAPRTPSFQVLSVTRRYRGVRIPVLAMSRAARKVGIPTHVWTVNDPREAQRLWKGGITGIVTDDPGAMIRARAAIG